LKIRIYNYPKWFTVLYPGSIWGFFRPKRKVLYLTFDDGPSVVATNYILNLLEQHSAKATFFCLGEQVVKEPLLYQKILAMGHGIGNHSMTHPRGLRTDNDTFLKDVENASQYIHSKFFRPPYGSLKFSQHKALKKMGYTTVFWSYVTYDFEKDIPIQKIIRKMKQKVRSGDIIVFHDSGKAFPQLQLLLPETLAYYSKKGFVFEIIPNQK
jgi:peptidoglycan/xylan/chitin deacetylase (PgdA/CDA1 family)